MIKQNTNIKNNEQTQCYESSRNFQITNHFKEKDEDGVKYFPAWETGMQNILGVVQQLVNYNRRKKWYLCFVLFKYCLSFYYM